MVTNECAVLQSLSYSESGDLSQAVRSADTQEE